MKRIQYLCSILILLSPWATLAQNDFERPPNIVLILVDDMGYADLGTTGAKGYETPALDQLAAQGMRFTNFYVAQSVCSASRASILTGCYPNRVGIGGALNVSATIGINPDETLLPELLKQRGYATTILGKWHLGHREPFLPTQHGFDSWLGIPYSNDMWPGHPTIPQAFPPLPMFDNETVVETNPDQAQFTRRFTDRAVTFIEENKNRPFFLYLAHVMPHAPLYASDAFRSKSANGLYGDVIQEIDASVATLLDCLKRNDLRDNTLVIFLSDNGPWLSYGNHAGRADPFRSGKLTTWEGGLRVPCIVHWPGKIPEGHVSDELLASMDLLPTIAYITGAELPERPIDGINLWSLFSGKKGFKSPRDRFYYYQTNELQAVRHGPWKLHAPHSYVKVDGEPGRDGKPANWKGIIPMTEAKSDPFSIAKRHGYRIEKTDWALYHLQRDPGEIHNVIDQNPKIVAKLKMLLETAREDLGDSLTNRNGANTRAPGKI